VRTAGNPAAIFPAIRAAVSELDPTLPVINLRTHDEQIARINSEELLFARLSGFFGFVALALACVGLYGLMSFLVLHRTGEIGLRMAVGALPAQVLRMILRESLALGGLGVALGLPAAYGSSRFIESMLFGLSPADSLTYGSVALILIVVALLSSLLPARRAAQVDPMAALRVE
jgi:ABC-type antimicrobial peptide transport system permease subunit